MKAANSIFVDAPLARKPARFDNPLKSKALVTAVTDVWDVSRILGTLFYLYPYSIRGGDMALKESR
jgi:hypothetical protein